MFFVHSIFIIMSQVTATTTTPPLKVVCSKSSLITMTVMKASGQCYVVLPPKLIPRDTVRGSIGLTTVLQWQEPQSQIPS